MKKLLLIASTAAISLSSFAATRLTFDIKGQPVPIAWDAAAFPISFQIVSR